ncbi:hypothetical protein [Gallibacterium anatis]|nr:hypothetical protein [Gallibacterium anatis]
MTINTLSIILTVLMIGVFWEVGKAIGDWLVDEIRWCYHRRQLKKGGKR